MPSFAKSDIQWFTTIHVDTSVLRFHAAAGQGAGVDRGLLAVKVQRLPQEHSRAEGGKGELKNVFSREHVSWDH